MEIPGRIVLGREPRGSYWEWLRKRFAVSISDIGSVDAVDLEKLGIAVPYTAIFCSIIFAVFVSILSHLITLQTTQNFLSLTVSRGLECNIVPILISNSFDGSLTGVWNTDPSFNLNTTFFELEFLGSSVDLQDYQRVMANFSSQLYDLGQVMKTRSRFHNLLVLNNFGFVDKATGLQLQTNVDVGIALNREVTLAAISNKDGVCWHGRDPNHYIYGTYNAAERALQLSMPLTVDPVYVENVYAPLGDKDFSSKLYSQNSCLKQILKKNYVSNEWKSELRDGQVTFSMDVVSFALAVALNLGQSTISGLNTMVSKELHGFIGYVDPWFDPPMQPVWCLNKNSPTLNLTEQQINGPSVCLVQTNEGISTSDLYYPIFGQYYPDETQCLGIKAGDSVSTGSCRRRLCRCSDHITPEVRKFCMQDNYLFGFITGNINSKGVHDDDYSPDQPNLDAVIALGLKLQKFLIDDPVNGDLELQEFAGRVMTYTLNVARSPKLADEPIVSWQQTETISHRAEKYQNNSWANGLSFNQLLTQAWEEVCFNCSAIVFEEIPGLTMVNKINRYTLKYDDLAVTPEDTFCVDVISQTAAMQGLSSKPPTDLVYPYFQCTKTVAAAFLGSFGSALASSNFIALVSWAVLGYILIKIMKHKSPGNPLLRSRRQKVQVEGLYASVISEATQQRDDKLLETIDVLLKKVQRLEEQVSQQQEQLKQSPPLCWHELQSRAAHLRSLQGDVAVAQESVNAKRDRDLAVSAPPPLKPFKFAEVELEAVYAPTEMAVEVSRMNSQRLSLPSRGSESSSNPVPQAGAETPSSHNIP